MIVVIGLAIALLLADTGLFAPPLPKTANEPSVNVNQPPTQNLPTNEPVIQGPILTSAEQHITTVARNFAERFASFSSDSRYANLEEVKLLASARLTKQLEEMIEQGAPSANFYGVSSKVLKVKINSLDEAGGLALATVTLQREETKQNEPNLVYYQDLELKLIKSGEEWLVDSYKWQAQK